METIAFVVLALASLSSAVVVITHRNPVVCALALAFNLVSIAGFFLLLNAQFIAFLQVIVYAGAIMVLVLFVLMLLNIGDEAVLTRSGFFQRWLGRLGSVALVVLLVWVVRNATRGRELPETSRDFGTVAALGNELFTRFVYPFEAISLLLVVAMIGAVLLAKRRL